ncbi:MAG: hypothetical protein ACR2J8_11910 [Thermomicrobiales bacterium]
MNSSMIGKIEKAHRYASEPERATIEGIEVLFRGGHDDYTIRLADGHWSCTCNTFSTHIVGTCAHIMALQQMLGQMLAADARFETGFETPAPAGA